MPDEGTSRQTHASRAVHLVMVAVMGLSFVGLFVGIRQAPRPDGFELPERMPPTGLANTVPAMSYAEFDRRLVGRNRDWQSTMVDLDSERSASPQSRWSDPGMFDSFITERADRRAFDGAPPTVPHPIEQISVTECLVCHAQARHVGSNIYAPAMSHDLMPNCTQCHIEANSPLLEVNGFVENTFQGTIRPTRGSRAWSAAPPTVPHALVMRENCLSCHGPAGAHAIRTEHPWDAVCLQCHLPANFHDQFARPDTLRRLGILESMRERIEPDIP